MGYVLGVDVGTTYTAAAVDLDGRTEIFQLGSRAATIPSLVVLRSDGEVLTGEAAERRSQMEPTSTAREFKRRLGDPVPLLLGRTPYGAEAIYALMLRSVVDQVSQQQGMAPDLVVITHPAAYGPYKLDLLRQAVRQAEIGETVLISEPEAAAIHYAGQERIEPGAVIAVYDFGGGTFDAAVLRKTDDGFEMLGDAEGLERLGGVDFDEAILGLVNAATANALAALDQDDPGARAAASRLRDDCRQTKEALSSDTESVVPVLLPGLQTEVRLTRDEFEEMVRPRLRETIAALERSVRSAGLTMEQVDRILLVGGSSRIPLVGALVREATGRPTAIDAHPKHAIALGAALMGRRQLAAGGAPATTAVPVVAATAPAAASLDVAGPPPPPPPPAPPGDLPPEGSTPLTPAPAGGGSGSARGRLPGRLFLIGAAVAVAVLSAGGALALILSGDDGDTAAGAGEGVTPEPTDAAAALVTATATATPTAATPSPTPTRTPTAVATIATPSPSPSPTPTRTPTPTATATPTPSPTPTPTVPPLVAAITGITVAGSFYEVQFTTTGFVPSLSSQHLHFFWDTVPPDQAGSPGSGPWIVHDSSQLFRTAVAMKPPAAEKLCVLVANPDHTVIPGTGNCHALP